MKKYIVSRETLEKWKYTGLIKYIPTDLPDCHCTELRKRNEELEKENGFLLDKNTEFAGRFVSDSLEIHRLRTALEEIRDHHGENKYTKLCDIADEALKGEK